MEVLVGPTFGIEVSSNPAYVRDTAQDKHAVASCLFLKDDEDDGAGAGICAPNKLEADESSENSSSIGAPDDSDDDHASSHGDGDGDEVQSKFRGGSLSSLDSLEESLPIKRGLSNHFSGKSKSFQNLSEVSTVIDLKKKENPLNKRRRLLIASKWSKKSFYSWSNPKSMPLLTLHEDEEHHHHQPQSSSMNNKQKHDEEEDDSHEEDEEQDDDDDFGHEGLSKFQGKRLSSFKIRSCFSLADLQEHGEIDRNN